MSGSTSAVADIEAMPVPGRARRVAGWVAVALIVPVVFAYMVMPAITWVSASVSGFFGIRAEADIPGALVWLAIGIAPSALAILMWRVTNWLPLRRERFVLAGLVGSVVGFLSFLPMLASPI
jgi:hypothetical protein